MAKLFANSGDPDQTPHSAASDLGLHCLPITHLGIFRLNLVKPNQVKICLKANTKCWILTIWIVGPLKIVV